MARLGISLLALSGLTLAAAWLGGGDPAASLAGAADAEGPGGLALLAMVALAASLVSEDLTCIGLGALAGSGAVPLGAAVAAAAFALFVGDLLLYGAGRFASAPLLAGGPLRRVLVRARQAAERPTVGPGVLIASRFVPGTRLPTYVAAGALRYPFPRFALWLALGVALWAPLLVGSAAAFGELVAPQVERLRLAALPVALAIVLTAAWAARTAPRLATRRGRRHLVGAWRRLSRWEFWPRWAVYGPLLPWLAALALRHRSLRVVTAANPGLPGGGLVGESKGAILEALARGAPDLVARTLFLAPAPSTERLAAVRDFLAREALAFPIVVKPDVGERGRGVAIVRDAGALARYLEEHPEALLVQEHVAGSELGLFYVREPWAERGRLTSIAEKRPIAVIGDGRRSLEDLILDDERAVCLAPVHLARHAGRLAEVPAAGERVALVEIGTHSAGALFLDAASLRTPALEAAVERASRSLPGFHLGRYDARADSLAAFQEGRFRIVELNGLTAEPAHVYDPRHGLGHALRTLAAQWRLAFAIGAAHRAAGVRPATWAELRALWRGRARG